MKRYRYGHLIDTQGNSFEADPGESEADFLRRTANAVAADIEKKNTGVRSDQQASLAVAVPITSLGEWLQVRERLASVASIRKVDLLSLSRQEARLEIKYVGGQDQLKSSLAEVNLDLGGDGPVWRIQPPARRVRAGFLRAGDPKMKPLRYRALPHRLFGGVRSIPRQPARQPR